MKKSILDSRREPNDYPMFKVHNVGPFFRKAPFEISEKTVTELLLRYRISYIEPTLAILLARPHVVILLSSSVIALLRVQQRTGDADKQDKGSTYEFQCTREPYFKNCFLRHVLLFYYDTKTNSLKALN